MTHFRQADYRVRHFSFSFSELFRQFKNAWASPGCNHRNTRFLVVKEKKSCFSQPSVEQLWGESAFATGSHGFRRNRVVLLRGLSVICEDPPQNLLRIGEEVSAAYLFLSASFRSFIQPFKALGFVLRPTLR